jgi:Tfp pilus assembly protein PilX
MVSEDSMIRRAAGVQVSMATLVQGAITVVVGYLLTMVLGMDAKVARLEERATALRTEASLHTEHAKESLKDAEEAHRAIWEALRRKQDKR